MVRILLPPSINNKENVDSYCFVISLWLFILNVPWKSNMQKKLGIFLQVLRSLTKIAGSGSVQNCQDQQHCRKVVNCSGSAIGSGTIGQRFGSPDFPNFHGTATLLKTSFGKRHKKVRQLQHCCQKGGIHAKFACYTLLQGCGSAVILSVSSSGFQGLGM